MSDQPQAALAGFALPERRRTTSFNRSEVAAEATETSRQRASTIAWNKVMVDELQLERRISTTSVTSRGTLLARTPLDAKTDAPAKRSSRISFACTTESVPAPLDLAMGDSVETTSPVIVRKEENIESDVIMELPVGTALEIKTLGFGRRALVATTDANAVEGWISVRTPLNQPLVMKQASNEKARVEVGAHDAISSGATPRIDTASPAGANPTGPRFGASGSRTRQLLEAARSGDMELLKHVVEVGASTAQVSIRPNLNVSDIRGKTALMYASAFGNKDIVEYLLSRTRDVDVNAVDDTQKSALHHASKRSRTRRVEAFDEIQASIVNLLLQRGADIEARDHNGCTALMLAVANGDTAVARQLLGAQANVDVKDFEGHTPLDYARSFHHDAVATLLVNAGACSNEGDASEDDSEAASVSSGALQVPRHSVPEIELPASPAPSSKERKEIKEDKQGRKLSKKKTKTSLMAQDDQEGGEKPKKKGSKDSKKGEKKPKKSKKAISAMMEAIDDENNEAVSQVTVQENATEEEDDKSQALRKLAVVMESVTAHKVLPEPEPRSV